MKLKLLLAMLVFGAISTHAQTPYNLPNSSCSVSGTSFLWCSSMGIVKVSGTNYGVSIGAIDITNIYQNPASAPVVIGYFGAVTLQNLVTDFENAEPLTSGTYENHHLTLGFSGAAFTGEIELDLVQSFPPPPCGKGCRIPRWTAENVVLTLD